MSEEQGKPFEVVADEALEARIVSWVLGEVSEFEVGELERLCEEQPEMEVFRRRIVAVHGLAGEGLKKPETDWKLPETKRQKVLDVIGGPAREVRRERASRFAARRVLLAAAACLALTVIVTALVFPIFFGARAWKSGSDGAAADMEMRNATTEHFRYSGTAGAERGSGAAAFAARGADRGGAAGAAPKSGAGGGAGAGLREGDLLEGDLLEGGLLEGGAPPGSASSSNEP